MSQPSSNKKRSRRLMKKLHLGEFQEFGFEFSVRFKQGMSPENGELLAGKFLSEIIEPKGLGLGGWINQGYIAKAGRGSVSEEDRNEISNWLKTRNEIESVHVGPLTDAWYTTK